MAASPVPSVTLRNGVEIPQLGFGVYKVPAEDTESVVGAAFDAGYRHIDTAQLYGNEEGVGRAVRASGLPRDEVFVTTKIWNDDQGYDSALRSFDGSLDRLGLEVLDLLLIHWPAPAQDRYVDTWRAFEQLLADGRVRAIGVSNFHAEHLQRLADETTVVPAVNQIELHPLLPQDELRAVDAERGIVTEAWSPLARGKLLDDPVITGIAERVGATPAQVVLRWHLQLGNVVIPKSVTPARIVENIDLFAFELDAEAMTAIGTLADGTRLGPHPDTLG
jgi:diketogulonate reductase-like aldo/keto reductase